MLTNHLDDKVSNDWDIQARAKLIFYYLAEQNNTDGISIMKNINTY